MYRILLSEFRLQALHYSTAIAVIFSFLFGVFLINNQTPDVDIMVGGPFFIIKTFAVQLLLTPGLIALFAHRASVRDFEHNMDGLIYSATTRIYTLIVVRLFVLIALNCFLFFSFGLGLIFGLANDPEASLTLGFQTLSWILSMLVLPNTVLVSTILFIIGLRSKQSLHIYIAAITLFFAYQFFLMASGSPLMASNISPNKELAVWYLWLDPYGIGLFFDHVKEWSIMQKNQQIPGFSIPMMINRLAFLFTAGLIAYFGIKHHLQDQDSQHNSAAQILEKAKRLLTALFTPILTFVNWPINFINQSLNRTLPYSPLLIVASMAWRLTMKTKTFLALSILLLIVIISEVYFGYTNLESLGTQAMPTTLITLNRYISDILPQFCGFFIVLLCAELCWRDPTSKIKPIVDCTPISNHTIFFGRLLAVSFVPILFVTIVIAVSLATQAAFSGKMTLYPYLLLYPFVVIPLAILGIACIVINHITPNKYWALSLSLLWFLWTQSSFPSSLGIEHPLWTLGLTQTFFYSDLTAFDGQLLLFWETNLLRAALVLLGCIVCLKHSSFRESMFRHSLNRIPYPLLLSIGVLGVAGMVANLLLQTHFFGDYQSAQQRHQWKADYEIRFNHRQNIPSLQQRAVRMNVDVYPEKEKISVEGEYYLENTHNVAVTELFFNTPKPFTFKEITVEKAQLVDFEGKFDSYLYRFTSPVNPGERITLRFKADFNPSGYQRAESDKIITANYVYMRMLRFMPWIGYVSEYELKDNNLRREFGLTPTINATLAKDLKLKSNEIAPQYNRVDFEVTITTSDKHTAFAPGELIYQWQTGDRRGFHYKTRSPIPNLIHIISTNMPHVTTDIDDTNVNVLFPKGKKAHGEKHLEAIKDAMAYGNKYFGHYNYSQFNLVPASVAMPIVGYALPQTVFIGESVGFHADLKKPDGFDNLYRRTVHEVAHQWWGYHLNIGDIEGSGVLAETLAKYTELVLIRRKYGKEYAKRLVAYEQNRYFQGRSRDTVLELPLYRADSGYLIYSKGSAAMHAILEVLGEDRINKALKSLLSNHSTSANPATTLDLIRYLNEAATANEQAVIDAWFKGMYVHDVAIEKVSVTHENGLYRASICIIDHQKTSTSVQLTAYDLDENIIGMKDIQKELKDHTCTDWILTSQPKSFEIDANLLLLDSDRGNNVYEVPSA